MTKTYNNYEDLITFTRASGGHALRPVSYGSELIDNGTFDSDSNWLKGTGWSISGGVAVSAGSNNYAGLQQSPSLVVGKVYSVTFTISSYTSGSVKIGLGETVGITYSAEGTYTETFVYTGPHVSGFKFSIFPWGDFVGSIDNVSVKEVTFDQPDGTLTLFEHPTNIPRVEYDADGNRLGLLVEEARTNLDTASDFFAGGGGVTAVKNYTAPDKTLSASTISYSGGLTPYLNTTNIAFTSGTTYTFSFFFKRGTGTQNVQTLLYGSAFNSGGANCVVVYDLDAETTTVASGTFTAHSVENIGNGWYRCSCSSTATASVSQNQQIYRASTADDGNYDYIWGKQVEAGAFPTSYIKSNSGSTTTRSAEVASIPVADFGYNTSNVGTLFCHISGMSYEDGGTGYPVVLRFDNASNANDRRGFFVSEGSNLLRSEVISNSVGQAGLTVATGSGGSLGEVKMVLAMAENDFAVSSNGGTVSTDTSGTVASNLPIATLGTAVGDRLNGHIKSIKYYPRRLTNAQLQDITS